jgi:TRAP-type mannitol/chloroaromatic compound transport system permease small subunit
MPIWIEKISQTVQRVMVTISRTVSYLILLITLTISIEVIGRYVFNHPTSWVWPVNRQLFGIFILIALAYTQSQNGHIQIEIFYEHFPPALKTCARWFAFFVSLAFVGVLVWQTSIMAEHAVVVKERASGAFRIPLYPFKVLIPVASFILGIEVIVSFFRKKPKCEDE